MKDPSKLECQVTSEECRVAWSCQKSRDVAVITVESSHSFDYRNSKSSNTEHEEPICTEKLTARSPKSSPKLGEMISFCSERIKKNGLQNHANLGIGNLRQIGYHILQVHKPIMSYCGRARRTQAGTKSHQKGLWNRVGIPKESFFIPTKSKLSKISRVNKNNLESYHRPKSSLHSTMLMK